MFLWTPPCDFLSSMRFCRQALYLGKTAMDQANAIHNDYLNIYNKEGIITT